MVSDKYWNFYSFFYNPLLKVAEKERSVLYENLALEPKLPLNVYVAGCGTGLDFPYLPAGSRVLGVDFSANMLRKAASVAQQLAQSPHFMQIQLRQGYAELSELPDNSQDLVLLHLILAVTSQPQALLNEAVRVLKPNGKISLWDKFLPDEQYASLLRQGLNKLTTKLATSINLQIEPLLANLPLRIVQREFRVAKFMQHIILQKE